MHEWIVFVHVLGAFLFAAGHGVSALVAFRLRSEREPSRIAALLEFSTYSMVPMLTGFLILLLAGIAAGFSGNFWGTWWIWISIVLLIVVGGAMSPLGSMHYNNVRHAFGLKGSYDKKDEPIPTPASAEEQERLLTSSRPWLLTALGGIGFAVIVYLMTFKPF